MAKIPLFDLQREGSLASNMPLAARMRPRNFAELVGQEHLVGEGRVFRKCYGKGYKYAHDYPGHFVKQQNLPPALQGKRYYIPSNQGYEEEVNSRLKAWWGEHKSETD